MKTILLSEKKIIEQILLIPGLRDPNGYKPSKLKIAKYYCYTYLWTLTTIKNKIMTDSRGLEWLSVNQYDQPFLEEVTADPISFELYRNNKYKWNFPLKIKNEEIEFDKKLYEKLKTILIH